MYSLRSEIWFCSQVPGHSFQSINVVASSPVVGNNELLISSSSRYLVRSLQVTPSPGCSVVYFYFVLFLEAEKEVGT